MPSDEFAFSQGQFDAALAETIKKVLVNRNLATTPSPTAFLLGGQSGAGKSALHRILSKRFCGNAIIVNGDEYRRMHPQFESIQAQHGKDAPLYTAKWSGAMAEALIDAFSNQKFNLIIEGTLRTSEVPLRTATLLRNRGYGISLAVMAVKPAISLVSCQIRYELMRIAGTTPRATDPNHHDRVVRDIVENLATLEKSGLFDEVLVYNRACKCLYPGADPHETASEVMSDTLFGPYTEEEQLHLKHLQEKLRELRSIAQGGTNTGNVFHCTLKKMGNGVRRHCSFCKELS